MLKRLGLATLVLTSWAHADHDRGFYAGANIGLTQSESIVAPEADDDKIRLPSFELVGGYKFNGWLGADIRYGASSQKRDLSIEPGPGRLEYSVDSYQSLYYRPELTNKEAKIYLLIGYTQLDTSVSSFTGSGDSETLVEEADSSESGTSYGLGIGWFINERINVNVEYRELLDDDDTEFSILTIGADYRF